MRGSPVPRKWPRGASHRKCTFGLPRSLLGHGASPHFWVTLITMRASIFRTDYGTVVSSKDRQVRFEFPVRPVATRDELDQAFPSAASRDFLGAWLVPKCVEFRGGAIWKVEIAALRGWARSHARCAPAAPASLTGHNTEPSPCTHNTSRATPRLENLG